MCALRCESIYWSPFPHHQRNAIAGGGGAGETTKSATGFVSSVQPLCNNAQHIDAYSLLISFSDLHLVNSVPVYLH